MGCFNNTGALPLAPGWSTPDQTRQSGCAYSWPTSRPYPHTDVTWKVSTEAFYTQPSWGSNHGLFSNGVTTRQQWTKATTPTGHRVICYAQRWTYCLLSNTFTPHYYQQNLHIVTSTATKIHAPAPAHHRHKTHQLAETPRPPWGLILPLQQCSRPTLSRSNSILSVIAWRQKQQI